MLIFFLDLDGLKETNDTFGHCEGDRPLAETAEILKQVFHRDLDLIAHFGGDEFVVLTIDSLNESSEVISIRLQERLKLANAQLHRRYQLFFCIGVTGFHLDRRMTINDLMAEADESLYKNKRARTSRHLIESLTPIKEIPDPHLRESVQQS
jgi:diguanylate cyclase (GGDEF)-like protein